MSSYPLSCPSLQFLPSAQARQLVWPCSCWWCPGAHSVQLLPPSMQYVDASSAYVLDVPGDTTFHAHPPSGAPADGTGGGDAEGATGDELRHVHERRLSETFGDKAPAQVTGGAVQPGPSP